ncbi:MAG: hypothetical protein GY773_19560 [Actinomycetia bacterium]|nr:hypothetical protein [Actinomycetes bacterium]
MKTILVSPSVRNHLLIVGAAVFIGAAVALRFLSGISIWWVLAAVSIVAHIGLIMTIGGAIARLAKFWPSSTPDVKAND